MANAARAGIAGDGLALGAPFLAGALGAIPTFTAIPTWYRKLDRPSWNPPDAVFGPVWTTLYLLIGVAMVLVRRAGRAAGARSPESTEQAERAFGLQLALNVAWSYAFFGLRSPAAGAAVIVALWLAIVATIAAFARHSRLAAALLVPYLAWVTFAAALNVEVWRRNPG